MSGKDHKLIFHCLKRKMNYNKNKKNELIKRLANTYTFCNGDINKLLLLLRKVIYPYEQMDSWERFDEIS